MINSPSLFLSLSRSLALSLSRSLALCCSLALSLSRSLLLSCSSFLSRACCSGLRGMMVGAALIRRAASRLCSRLTLADSRQWHATRGTRAAISPLGPTAHCASGTWGCHQRPLPKPLRALLPPKRAALRQQPPPRTRAKQSPRQSRRLRRLRQTQTATLTLCHRHAHRDSCAGDHSRMARWVTPRHVETPCDTTGGGRAMGERGAAGEGHEPGPW